MFKLTLSDDVKKALKPALWGNSSGVVFAEIEKGISHVFVTTNGSMFVVTRMEGRELVVVAVVGKDLLNNRQEIISYAIANGAMFVRFHTKSPRHLMKGLAGLDVVLDEVRPRRWAASEYIYKVAVV